MYFHVKIISVALILLAVACGSEDHKVRKRDLIPERDLVPILTDLYISDGLLVQTPVRANFSAKDSIINYIEVIEKHGYKKENMDLTLRHYFKNNPRKLQKIYDQVLADLSKMQSELDTEAASLADTSLWNQKTSLSLPEDGINNPLSFSIPVADTGLYVLSFICTVYRDDQSLNPVTSVYFWHSDTTSEGAKDLWEKVELIRDGSKHKYSISKRLSDTAFTHINGRLFDSDPQEGRWENHAKFSGILLKKGKAE